MTSVDQQKNMKKFEIPANVFDLPEFHETDILEVQKDNEKIFSSFRQIFGSLELALCYERSFYPQFVEYHGDIFLKQTFSEEKYISLKKFFADDAKKLQIAMNSFSMRLLFGPEQLQVLQTSKVAEIANNTMYYLACKIQENWKIILSTHYPNKVFSVILQENGDEKIWGVSFFEKKENFTPESSLGEILGDAEFEPTITLSSLRKEYHRLRYEGPRKKPHNVLRLALQNLSKQT